MRYAKDVTLDVLKYRLERIGFGSGDRTSNATGEASSSTVAAYELKSSPHSSHGVLLRWLEDRPAGRLLDVGCSDGSFGSLARARGGHLVVGVDVVKHEGVADNLDGFVEADLDDGLPTEIGAGFDTVVAADVLEHTADPGRLLRSMIDRLGPGGSILISVPNFAHWYPRLRVVSGRFDYDQRGLLDRGHLRFFTRRTLERLIADNGLVVVRRAVVGSPVEVLDRGADSPIGRIARAAGAVDRLATRAWPTLFGYQFLYELQPGPVTEPA
jgi:SAM-dependent methyltransferase